VPLTGVRFELAVEPAAFTGFSEQRQQGVRQRRQQQKAVASDGRV